MNLTFLPNEAYGFGVAPGFGGGIPFDWSVVGTLDRVALMTGVDDKKEVMSFAAHFAEASMFQPQDQYTTNNLLSILQAVVKHFIKANKRAEKSLRRAKRENKELKRKIAKAPKIQRVVECPVCRSEFDKLCSVDAHIFTHHPEQGAVWQALRTPQYPGLTRSYDPLSSQVLLQRMMDKFNDHVSLELRSQEVETQLYFKEQLMTMQRTLDKFTDQESGAIHSPETGSELIVVDAKPVVGPTDDHVGVPTIWHSRQSSVKPVMTGTGKRMVRLDDTYSDESDAPV